VAVIAKADCEPKRFIREIRGPVGELEVGKEVTVGVFDGVKSVDVIGYSRGRGTGGVMERHGFKGQRATHGVKKCHRHPGSTGNRTFPGRLFKGHKMAGRYGNERITMRNLRVVRVDGENNLLLVRGAVPGPPGSYVIIRQTNKL
jgi:large subunit ribosomal protein L3